MPTFNSFLESLEELRGLNTSNLLVFTGGAPFSKELTVLATFVGVFNYTEFTGLINAANTLSCFFLLMNPLGKLDFGEANSSSVLLILLFNR